MAAEIVTKIRGSIFEIVLNRPDKRNAISLDMWQEVDTAVQAANRAPGIRCLLIRGEGKAFSAGIDISAFMRLKETYGEAWLQKLRGVTADAQAVVNRLERLEIPSVALLHGYCLGMGLELALACDFRLGTPELKLGLPEVFLGIIPDVGGTTRLTRLVGTARAKEMILTGRQVDATYAERIGLLNQVVPANELLAAGDGLAAELGKAAPLAIGMAKRIIDGMLDNDRGLLLEGWAQSALFQTEDFLEAGASMSQKRPAVFKGK